jgi:squalene-hopene/tetraprenyl-beta-curcumene cyclase
MLVRPRSARVRDTALAAQALLDAGTEPSHPALARASEWLVAGQSARPGDWSVRRPDLDPGGWAAAADGWFPNVEESASVLAVLARLPASATLAGRRALARGITWTLGMQGWRGGWGRFDAGGGATCLADLPLPVEGPVVDRPTAGVTARVLELMGTVGFDRAFGRVRRAAAFLAATQRTDGSWSDGPEAIPLATTVAAITGFAAVRGDGSGRAEIERAVDWVLARQRGDGGWGPEGSPGSTAVDTAHALIGLLVAGAPAGAVERAAEYLLGAQAADGTWPVPPPSTLGLPGTAPLVYHLDALVIPLMALGRYGARRRAAAGGR